MIVSPGVKVPPHAIVAPLDEVKPMVREEAMAAPAMLPPKDSPITSDRLHATRLEYEAEGWTRSETTAIRNRTASRPCSMALVFGRRTPNSTPQGRVQ